MPHIFNRLTHSQYLLRHVVNISGQTSATEVRNAQNMLVSSTTGALSGTDHSSLRTLRHFSNADDIIHGRDRDVDSTRSVADIVENNEGVISLGSSAIVLGGK